MKNVTALTLVALSLSIPSAAFAQRRPVPPAVPEEIQVPAGYKPFFAGHAIGTQGYMCVAVGNTFTWTMFGPQATLFNEDGQQIMTHYLSPTPYSLLPNPTWQHSRDTSAVWGQNPKPSTDSRYVAPDAIPWLLLEAAVVGEGPTGGDKMLPTRYIHRVNTVGGKAPTTGCASVSDLKKRELVYYEADYYFYKERNAPDTDQ